MASPFRHKLAVFLALLASAGGLAVAAPASIAAPADFYTPPTSLPAGQNGDVVKTLPSTYTSQSGVTSTRVMYLSRDAHDQPMAVTGTVLVPQAPWTGPGARPVVAYAPFTAGVADKCAVSKAIAGDTSSDLVGSVQTTFMNGFLAKGYAVAQTDYQGLGTPGDHTYAMRLPQAHAVLDVLRAARQLPANGVSPSAPVAIAGYSQGGGAAAAAAELASAYAPELNVVGTYAGAPPADLAVLAKSLDGGLYAGFEGFAIVGVNAAYPELNLTDLTNAQGKEALQQLGGYCTLDAVFGFAFKNTATLTKDGKQVSDYLAKEPYASVIATQKIGNVKPAAPVLVESSPNDDVVPNSQVVQLAKDWCGKGAAVQYSPINGLFPFFTHALSGFTAATNSANWVASRFGGQPAPTNCGKF
ncbi:lipase family protein [Amycolatopsis sp. H20-H5]|uniref:lipase family protein n=1 Tax=Amycolatopsis sp. H20-H5 TaxID=3046309 RepID=UPI002DBBB591|nr:lipase family protein [Amycolatopsis sp. H20-H5]MEC3979509.1 lipase family protein [Amycolatopsis sp. H20-H5]